MKFPRGFILHTYTLTPEQNAEYSALEEQIEQLEEKKRAVLNQMSAMLDKYKPQIPENEEWTSLDSFHNSAGCLVIAVKTTPRRS